MVCSTTAWRRWSALISRNNGSWNPGGGPDPAHDQPHLDRVLGPGERRVAGLGDIGAGDLRGGQPVGIRCQACSPMASIAARSLRSWRAVIENGTPNRRAVEIMARE